MYKRILIPTDGSKCSELGVHKGLGLAKALNASVTFLYAVEDTADLIYDLKVMHYEPNFYALAKQSGEASLAIALTMAETAGVVAHSALAERSSPVDAILAAEKENDLIVIATHGRRGFNHFIFGSVTEEVMRRSSIPCLILRAKHAAQEISANA